MLRQSMLKFLASPMKIFFISISKWWYLHHHTLAWRKTALRNSDSEEIKTSYVNITEFDAFYWPFSSYYS
ncbi:unnamed protein product [Blepharisma stoltei]|uniref:Uncharacterized protein n=1 Tax=Blepharisma stoltei TaxID=1481888 RepID=A0AAU9JD90_9CILI|nr:unnamed protein product [Blepharisma stoltei]